MGTGIDPSLPLPSSDAPEISRACGSRDYRTSLGTGLSWPRARLLVTIASMRTGRIDGPRRGKRTAIALLVLTLTATAVSAFVGRGYFVDSWWMWKLRSPERRTRDQAVEKLVERKCLRAVPAIFTLIIRVGSEESISTTTREDAQLRPIEYWFATPLILALWNMGEEALPAIEVCARHSGGPWGAEILRTFQDLRNRSLPLIAEELYRDVLGPRRKQRQVRLSRPSGT
jgi:hypothetical protein